MTYVLTAAIVVLAINLAVAVAGAARGSGDGSGGGSGDGSGGGSGDKEPDAWLLGVLISGTAGAAILAVALAGPASIRARRRRPGPHGAGARHRRCPVRRAPRRSRSG